MGGTGIEQEATTDRGKISEAAECPMQCAVYLLIFATTCATTTGFDMLTFKGTGKSGSTKGTGTDTIIGTRGTARTGSTRSTGTDPIIGARYATRHAVPITTRNGKEIRAFQERE